MEVLVTGGAGFIGSNIVERLVSEGHSVTVIDCLNTGSENNLAGVRDKIEFIRGNSGDIEKLASGKKFDTILHQGVYSTSPLYKENRSLTAKALEEFISVLEYCTKNKTRLVFASSSSLYNGITPPHREDAQIKVTDFYSEARLAMERVATLYHQLYGTKIIALRYFSVYGPHEEAKGKYANLVTQFLWAMMKGQPPVVYGDGKQTRDFVFVSNIVEANLLAMKSQLEFGIFNVGTGRSVSINEMIEILNRQLGTSFEPQYVENKVKNYVAHTQADTSFTKSKLGFSAKVSLEEGIGKLIEYTKSKN